MTLPLIILAAVSVVAGLIPFGEYVTWNREAYEIHINWTVAGTSIVTALIGIGLATVMYRKENNMPELAYQSTYSSLCAKGMEEGSDYILRVAGTGMPKMMVF